MNLHGIVRDLVDNSSLSGSHKALLRWHLDTDDPEVESPEGPEPASAAPETPEQELARLRAELAAVRASEDGG